MPSRKSPISRFKVDTEKSPIGFIQCFLNQVRKRIKIYRILIRFFLCLLPVTKKRSCSGCFCKLPEQPPPAVFTFLPPARCIVNRRQKIAKKFELPAIICNNLQLCETILNSCLQNSLNIHTHIRIRIYLLFCFLLLNEGLLQQQQLK